MLVELETDTNVLAKEAQDQCVNGRYDLALPRLHRLWQLGYASDLTALALGNVYMNRSEPKEAIKWFRQCLALNPWNYQAQENLIFMTDAQPDSTDDLTYAERRGWWDRQGQHFYARRPKTYLNTRDPEKALRVGYVSGDFNFHSAAIAWAPVARFHSDQIIPVFYSTIDKSNWDQVTREHWAAKVTNFFDVADLNAEELAQQIYDHEIDILVDLSGFTRNNRLLTFAARPAPIQVQGWGYVLGTASPAIDYILGDPIVCSEKVRKNLHEKVVDLPALLSYLPRPDMPEPNELPCATSDAPITFSVFQRAMKVNADNLAVYREILHRVPHSRIVFKGPDYNPTKRDEIVAALESIGRGRIYFDFQTAHNEHMLGYREVDLALDPWPQTGGISTLEGLWMGVPCVTLLGERMIQRTSASFLTCVGFADDCVAVDREDYVRKAIALVTYRRDRLMQMRKESRDRLKASPIMTGYVEAVEKAFREIWRKWCAEQEEAAA